MGTLRMNPAPSTLSSVNMKVLFCLVALFALGYAQPATDIFDEIALMNPEYVMGQECIEIQKTCLAAATTGIQKYNVGFNSVYASDQDFSVATRNAYHHSKNAKLQQERTGLKSSNVVQHTSNV